MPFSEAELKFLDNFFSTRSYTEGYSPSQSDLIIYQQLPLGAPINCLHLCRWYSHINSFGSEQKNFCGKRKSELTLCVDKKEVCILDFIKSNK